MLKEKIDNDLKASLKSKDTIRTSTLRLLKSALHNAEIAERQELKDEEVVAIIKKQLKQRRDSIEEFKKGNRQDLVDKETKESEILKGYLPEELSAEVLLGMVKEAIAETGAASPRDMGKVMKEVLTRARGRAEAKAVSELVKNELSRLEKPAEEENSKDNKNGNPA